mmetsp:Transcript_30567/g.47883  ORF Transcript_30567/g.47883 Transcript_30567/m.47883 type:complete len:131 (+) Transcript_30567:233-625(+)|eukprot:CAMPEP_0184309348 /NCGR_PEP_ID=MMETSP1049-20130417/17540_1 /TAXON_ID=77928 /ORGANISM="Proteomonas sulcata, Strain CCMP704" /LENGTH=130 /DNA_ID=CAMNT_0026622223 /DNA_START=209 /DNA_END=601 /DNA_ORIENTATION=+
MSGLNLCTNKEAKNTSQLGAGAIVEWDGQEWLMDGRNETQVRQDIREKMLQRFKQSSNNTNATLEGNSTANLTMPNSSAKENSIPAQAMLTCLYSLNGAFMPEGFLLAKDRMRRIRHIPCIAVLLLLNQV